MVLNIYKIGGSIVDNSSWLGALAEGLSKVPGKNLVVHGGGNMASDLCRKLGIEVRMHRGRRITDRETLEVIVMTYAGLANKTVVARLQAAGIHAVGLSGADGNMLQAHKRLPGTLDAGVDYGFAGDIDRVNTEVLQALLHADFVPVIAPVSHDSRGQLLNTNADTIAAVLCGALAGAYEVRLVYLLDYPGVMRDLRDPGSVIPHLKLSEIDALVENGTISQGMLPKLHNARQALEQGARSVFLTDIASLAGLGKGSGTRLTSN